MPKAISDLRAHRQGLRHRLQRGRGDLNEVQNGGILGTLDQRYDNQAEGFVQGCGNFLFGKKLPSYPVSYVKPFMVTQVERGGLPQALPPDDQGLGRRCGHEAAMLLELRGIRKRYGETQALDGLDLTATSGEILAVAGPNGAGKSTMIRILAGETGVDAGQILIDGQPWSAADRRHQIAVVHQEPQLVPT